MRVNDSICEYLVKERGRGEFRWRLLQTMAVEPSGDGAGIFRENGVNIMAADVLATQEATASAAKVLTSWGIDKFSTRDNFNYHYNGE